MNSYETDSNTLSEISPHSLVRYLLSLGWKQIETSQDFGIVIMRKSFGQHTEEILIPTNSGFADFSERIFDAIKLVSKLEKQSYGAIVDSLLNAGSDTLRLRISGSKIRNGLIPLIDEIAAKDGFKKVLLSTSCYLLEPKSFYKKLMRTEADQLIRNCYVGQSEKGSYVIKFCFPLLENPAAHKDKTQKPFARRVTEHLMISLYRLVGAINSQKPDEAFDQEISQQLNANFCFGLVEMQANNSNVDFDFQMSWCDELPVENNVPSKITIQDSFMQQISKLGEILKPFKEYMKTDFIGKVTGLIGFENDQGNMEGDISLSLLVDDETIKAKAILNSGYYRQACDAHRDGNYVRISGVLKEKPRLSLIEDISSFEVLSIESSDKH